MRKIYRYLFLLGMVLLLTPFYTLEGAIKDDMYQNSGILLRANAVNVMKLGGEYGWFMKDDNPSTGYTWRFIPDHLGVYALVQEIVLSGSVAGNSGPLLGVPGKMIWILKAVKPGRGEAIFAEFPPGKKEAQRQDVVFIAVNP